MTPNNLSERLEAAEPWSDEPVRGMFEPLEIYHDRLMDWVCENMRRSIREAMLAAVPARERDDD